MDSVTVLLVMLGVVFVGVVVLFISLNVRNNGAKNAKSIAKKSLIMLNRDVSSKYSRCTFYMYNDYNRGYSQSQWTKLYKTNVMDQNLDENSEEFAQAVAPFINAIVVDDNGYFMRRGMENLMHSGEVLQPGVNDHISLGYFVEPYETMDENGTGKRPKNQAAYDLDEDEEDDYDEDDYEEDDYDEDEDDEDDDYDYDEDDEDDDYDYDEDDEDDDDDVYVKYTPPQRSDAPRDFSANDLREAEKAYKDAVYKAKRYKGGPLETYYEIQEKKAYAALVSAQAKYDSRR